MLRRSCTRGSAQPLGDGPVDYPAPETIIGLVIDAIGLTETEAEPGLVDTLVAGISTVHAASLTRPGLVTRAAAKTALVPEPTIRG